MTVPFSVQWEAASFPWSIGSFVEAVRVRSRTGLEGEWWAERMHPGLSPAHRARVRRRWHLGTHLTSAAWPMVVAAGEDSGHPWAVVEPQGHRIDGTFPYAEPSLGLREVRSVALALAEAEALLARRFTRSGLALRPNQLTRLKTGRLMMNLAALDPQPDLGFPASPGLFLFTPEELSGQPATARTNVFVLGWLLHLALTGKAPYDVAMASTDGEAALREALGPLILGGRLKTVRLPEALKSVDVLIRRSLSPLPGSRLPSATAFAEVLEPFAPAPPQRARPAPFVSLAEPGVDPADEMLPTSVESRLVQHPEDRRLWLDLARDLAEVASPRAAFINAQCTANGPPAPTTTELVPSSHAETLELTWRFGYVKTMSVRAGPGPTTPDAVSALLQHPSLRFIQELRLLGPSEQARAWIEALLRHPSPALRTVVVNSVASTDPWAVDLAYRYPRWTWVWGAAPGFGAGVSGAFRRLLGLGSEPPAST